jgi:hypothetical protein
MIPGIGRLDSGFINTGGGFEISIGISSFAERRDQLLSVYRQAHFAQRGLHVINKAQVVGPAELPDGVPMTMELRQQIAAARAAAGKKVARIGEATDVDFIDDPELNGIVEVPDWQRIGEHLQAVMCPGVVVLPRELPCPSAEVATRLNREFVVMLRDDPQQAKQIASETAAAWMVSASKFLTLWPAVVVSPKVFAQSPGQRIHTHQARVGFADLTRRGLTVRNWLMNTVMATTVETLDRWLAQDILPQSHHFVGLTAENAADAFTSWAGGEAELAVITPGASAALGVPFGQVVPISAAAYAFVPEPYPIGDDVIILRRASLGNHSEPMGAVSVELAVEGGELVATSTYRHAFTPRQWGTSLAVAVIKEPS